ncbi:MAG: efflux RND transporter periplasmic adaptor subunit [Gemmataceae bacterium]|nr:efflux RND transporter periplasmic adaptor subunit [Gemmataceae bacterium]MCI0740088.1 efflux RND transporter periplasmic adaptor subunit [Gemmataceae bacterium]
MLETSTRREETSAIAAAQDRRQPEPQTHASEKQGARAWLIRSLPTILVLALLGGLAYWGHQNSWTIPKFSEFFGNGSVEKDDWCAAHSVPESVCVECNESLLPRIKAKWCPKHGVHYCPFERPEIAQLKVKPQITQADLDRAQRALDLKDRPENSPKCTQHHRRLQFASKEVFDKMDVGVLPVWTGLIAETIAVSGEITFEQPRVSSVSTAVPGRVWYVTEFGQVGAAVKRGDVLALVDALEVGKAKTEFLQAFAQFELKAKSVEYMRPLVKSGAISDPHFREAETSMREAQLRLLGAQQALVNLGLPVQLDAVKDLSPEGLSKYLQLFGIPAAIAQRLDAKTASANLIPILAPRDGIVTAANVTASENADPAKTMFVVADTSRMWLRLNVRNEDLKYVRVRDPKLGKPGQVVRFRPDGSDQDVTGELIWKSTQVDEKTRTVQLRAELPNPDGALLANTFGVGQIVLREEKDAVLIPGESVFWEGDCQIVFVQDKNFHTPGAPKVFHIRTVRVGVKNGPNTEIIAGLFPGEVVATKNSAVMRAELLKNNLGAG